MSRKPDLLDHPDLSKVWVSLESAAPAVELGTLAVGAEAQPHVRRPRSKRRLIAITAVFLMVVFVGTETFGVVSARRAIASGVVVTEGLVEVDIEVASVSEPWPVLEAPLGLNDLELRPEGIVAISSESEDDQQSWLLGVEGWTMIPDVTYPVDWELTVEGGFVSGSATDGRTTVFTGFSDALLSVDGEPMIWTSKDGGPTEPAALPGLRSLGFGYMVGGFRLSNGIDHVIHAESGFVAYSGPLQIWDGFEDFSLEPREAWSNLVLTSNDGVEWTPYVRSDFAVYQMVPFGKGIVAAASLPPESDTEILEVDGMPTEVAVSPPFRLYYSDDGLTWTVVANSPEFGKPLLSTASDGTVIAVDEYAAEDRATPTTEVFLLHPSSG